MNKRFHEYHVDSSHVREENENFLHIEIGQKKKYFYIKK